MKAWQQAATKGEGYQSTHRLKMKDGSHRWHLSRATAVYDEDGNVEGWYGTATDIHDLIEAEEHRKLLIDELNHRVKNTLAVVQAIAKQTFRSEAVARCPNRRIEGVLPPWHKHTTFWRANCGKWASLEDIARQACLARSPGSAQIILSGPPAALKPKQAVSLAMALHELYTNAIKYGSLGSPTGSAAFTWQIDPEKQQLKMLWVERGGPPATKPLKAGFGSAMI